MSILTETPHALEFGAIEAPGTRSREVVTIAASQTLKAGQVLGRRLPAASTSVGSTVVGTGDGTIGSITEDTNAKVGVYKIVCIEPASNAGQFAVYDPDGIFIGTATVGVAFNGNGINFTIADGATDFGAGAYFTVTVAGTYEYAAYNQDATDGLEVAVAICANPTTTTTAASALVVARDLEVWDAQLVWPSDIDADEKAAAIAALALQGIIVR